VDNGIDTVMQYCVVVAMLLAQASPPLGPHTQTTRHGPVELTIRLGGLTARLSDYVVFELHATAPAGYELEWPERAALGTEFEVWDVQPAGPIAQPDGRQRWELRARLEVLTPGRHEIPAAQVRYRKVGGSDWQTARTEPVAIEFRGDVPESAGLETAKPNPAPLDWPANLGAMVAGIGLGLVAVVATGWIAWWLWRRRRPPGATAPRIAPHQKALQALAELQRAGWVERDDFDAYYTRLSDIVRHYIEDRFGLRAPEQTTEEFLAGIEDSLDLSPAQRHLLARFLERCDMVKFARGRPDRGEAHTALDSARNFVVETASAVTIPDPARRVAPATPNSPSECSG
jgi:hypothetical protein